MIDTIYIISVGVVCLLWIYVALKDNGGFDKKEIVQLFYIISGAYVVVEILEHGIATLALILGTLTISVGMKVFKLLANGKDQR